MRKEKTPHIKNNLTITFNIQKSKVKALVIEVIEKYEVDATNNIVKYTNRGKKLYKHINSLKSIEINGNDDFDMYDENCNILSDNQITN